MFSWLLGSVAQAATIQFRDVAPARNLDYQGVGYGASWADANGDGRPDVWIGNHNSNPRLMLSGPGGFVDRTDLADHKHGDMHGAAWADIDNDGDQDLLIIKGANRGAAGVANAMLINENGQWRNRAVQLGLDYPYGRGRMPTWVDWNDDGLLDVLIVNSNDRTTPPEAPTRMFTANGSRFLQGSRTLHRTKATQFSQLMLSNPIFDGLPSLITQLNLRNYPDGVYTYSPAGINRATSTFGSHGIDNVYDVAVGDFNGDLTTDVLTVQQEGLRLMLATPQGMVQRTLPNIARNAFVVAGDFDNDRDLDIYLVRSHKIAQTNLANVLLRNDGTGHFNMVPGAYGAEGTLSGFASSGTVVDYNNDGFLDLFVNNGDNWHTKIDPARSQLFENGGNNYHWLQINLVGTQSNRDGIGARVIVDAGGDLQLRERNGGVHHRSQDHARLHFGLGRANHADSVTIYWPSGVAQRLENVAADQILTITERAEGNPYFAPRAHMSAQVVGARGVMVDASGSTDPDGQIVSYDWHFGDGNTGSGPVAVHVYRNDGTYDVLLTVTDDMGLTAVHSHTVTVTKRDPVAQPQLIAVGSKPGDSDKLIDTLANGLPDFASAWISGASKATSWFTFDLGLSRPVDEVLLAPRGDRTRIMHIVVSDTLVDNQAVGEAVECRIAKGVRTPVDMTACTLDSAFGRYVTVKGQRPVKMIMHQASVPALVEVNLAPVINGPGAATAIQGVPMHVDLDIRDPGGPAPIDIGLTGNLPGADPRTTTLPDGRTRITWTPPGWTSGDFTLRVAATDALGERSVHTIAVTLQERGDGALSATSASAANVVNLTTLGTLDWAHWGRTNTTDQKRDVETLVSAVAGINASPARFSNTRSSYKWTDGTPTRSSTGTNTGLKVTRAGEGMRFSVAATTTDRTLSVWVTTRGVEARLRASLSDSSAAPVELIVPFATSRRGTRIDLPFRAGAPGQTLEIEWLLTARQPGVTGWMTLDSVAVTQ